jgi:hypothetical protein
MTPAELELDRKGAWIQGNLAARQLLVDAQWQLIRERDTARQWARVNRAFDYLTEAFDEMMFELRLLLVDLEWPLLPIMREKTHEGISRK